MWQTIWSPVLFIFCSVLLGCSKRSPNQKLIDAAANGDVTSCERFIEAGVPVDSTDENGHTALDWAVYQQQSSFVKRLLDLGANVNFVDQAGKTPLMYTVYSMQGKARYSKETMQSRNQIANILLERGAKVNIATRQGDTVLHFAVQDQNPSLIRMLLAAKADKNAKTLQGYTPVDIANFPFYSPNRDVLVALSTPTQ